MVRMSQTTWRETESLLYLSVSGIRLRNCLTRTGRLTKLLSLSQAIVLDEDMLPVASAPVTFTIKAGGGHFANGLTVMTLTSNGSGIAEALLTLGQSTAARIVKTEGDIELGEILSWNGVNRVNTTQKLGSGLATKQN